MSLNSSALVSRKSMPSQIPKYVPDIPHGLNLMMVKVQEWKQKQNSKFEMITAQSLNHKEEVKFEKLDPHSVPIVPRTFKEVVADQPLA